MLRINLLSTRVGLELLVLQVTGTRKHRTNHWSQLGLNSSPYNVQRRRRSAPVRQVDARLETLNNNCSLLVVDLGLNSSPSLYVLPRTTHDLASRAATHVHSQILRLRCESCHYNSYKRKNVLCSILRARSSSKTFAEMSDALKHFAKLKII